MEKILKQILEKLEKLERLEQRFERFEQRFEQRFEGIEQRFEGVEQRFEGVEQRFERFEQRFERLEPLVRESHQWIRTLVESNEIHKAEMDIIKNDVARVEGVLVGFDKSLETLRKAQ